MQGRAGQLRKGKIADDFDAFMHAKSGGTRGWDSATDDDVFDWFCFLDTQGGGTKWVHSPQCPAVGSASKGACPKGASCTRRYAAESLCKRVPFQAQDGLQGAFAAWGRVERSHADGKPLFERPRGGVRTYAAEEQKRAGVTVNEAPPILQDTLSDLLRHMRF